MSIVWAFIDAPPICFTRVIDGHLPTLLTSLSSRQAAQCASPVSFTWCTVLCHTSKLSSRSRVTVTSLRADSTGNTSAALPASAMPWSDSRPYDSKILSSDLVSSSLRLTCIAFVSSGPRIPFLYTTSLCYAAMKSSVHRYTSFTLLQLSKYASAVDL